MNGTRAVERARQADGPGSSAGGPPLSGRELEVLRQLADGQSTARIGAALSISGNTVRTHVRTLMRKLAVEERTDLVRRAGDLQLG